MPSIKQYFDSQANDYLFKSSLGIWSILRNKEKVAIQNAFEPFSGMACLELGSGSGYYTPLLASFSPSRLVAVDISHAMLSNLRISQVIKIQADIQNISFQVTFDRVLCAGAIEFLPNPESFFINIKQLLSKDGKLILLLPTKGIMGQIYKWFHRSHQIKITLFDQTMLKTTLEKHKLKIDLLEKPTPMTYVLRVLNA